LRVVLRYDREYACNPETVWLTHGYPASVAGYLVEQGRDAKVLDLRGRNEGDEDATDDTIDAISSDDKDSASGEFKPS